MTRLEFISAVETVGIKLEENKFKEGMPISAQWYGMEFYYNGTDQVVLVGDIPRTVLENLKNKYYDESKSLAILARKDYFIDLLLELQFYYENNKIYETYPREKLESHFDVKSLRVYENMIKTVHNNIEYIEWEEKHNKINNDNTVYDYIVKLDEMIYPFNKNASKMKHPVEYLQGSARTIDIREKENSIEVKLNDANLLRGASVEQGKTKETSYINYKLTFYEGINQYTVEHYLNETGVNMLNVNKLSLEQGKGLEEIYNFNLDVNTNIIEYTNDGITNEVMIDENSQEELIEFLEMAIDKAKELTLDQMLEYEYLILEDGAFVLDKVK